MVQGRRNLERMYEQRERDCQRSEMRVAEARAREAEMREEGRRQRDEQRRDREEIERHLDRMNARSYYDRAASSEFGGQSEPDVDKTPPHAVATAAADLDVLPNTDRVSDVTLDLGQSHLCKPADTCKEEGRPENTIGFAQNRNYAAWPERSAGRLAGSTSPRQRQAMVQDVERSNLG